MTRRKQPPMSESLAGDIEYLADRPTPYPARVRWTDTETGRRRSISASHATAEEAAARVNELRKAAAGGVGPAAATMTLAEYGELNMLLALRGLEAKTTDPYRAGWKLRVVPTLGHLPIRMITNGAVDRAVHSWIADECGKSTVKNSLAILVRVMEQAVRDGIIERNPARITGWQREYLR
jgi:hypothetical protein